MGHFRQKIVAVHVPARVLVQMKFVTGGEGAAVAGARNHMVQRLFFLHADFGGRIAFGLLGVNSRVIVDFIFGVAPDFGDSLYIGHQGSVGGLKIIVGEGVLAGPQLLLGAPALHNVLMKEGAAGCVVEADFMLDGTVLVYLRLVGENQFVGVLIVLKEIEDAVLFHQTRHKIKSGLAVLDDVFALGVTALGAILKILEAVVLKDFLDDFGNGFLLENLAISGAREEPKPRNNLCPVMGKAVVASNAGEAAYKTIPVPHVIVCMVDLQGHLLADNVLEGNGMILRKKVECEME